MREYIDKVFAKPNIASIIAVVWILSCIAVMSGSMFFPLKASETLANRVVDFMFNISIMIVSYYFGASKAGRSEK